MARDALDPRKLDPKAVRLTCGLEIHQQLATRKLFCGCPSIIREDAPDFTVTRQLRASAGESGEVDTAAAHETLKAKSFKYQGYHGTTCLVELDEEPPHPLNPEALHVALQVAKILKMTILPRVQVMRKTVVDGSNTGGFQRTVMLAVGGEMEVPVPGGRPGPAHDTAAPSVSPADPKGGNPPASSRKKSPSFALKDGDGFGTLCVSIQSLCLEEDAAKIVERTAAYDVYNLSRLGIPLVEIATGPDLHDPVAVQAAAAHIGMLLRSTRKVKRGLGTIRQDVNISVLGGARVEVKGAQDLRGLPDLVRWEASRQVALVQLAGALKEKECCPSGIIDITVSCRDAKGFLKKSLEKGDAVIGVGLPGLAGILGTELVPGYRVGTELAGYAKAHGFGGIIHADEDSAKYGLDFAAVRKALGLKNPDSFLLLVGDAAKCRDLLENILLPRVAQLWKGVPREVRKTNPDNTTAYQRPMSGAARMYPETDIPDISIDASAVEAPMLLDEQVAAFAKQHGLDLALAKEAIEEPAFEELVLRFPKVPARLIADALVTMPKEIRRREGKEMSDDLLSSVLPDILGRLNDGVIPREAVYELLVDAAHGRTLSFDKYAIVDDEEIAKVVTEVRAANPGAPLNALMGLCMAKLRGKADGKKVMELLKR